MKLLVLVALLGCVVADPEADPALYYSSGIYSGLGYGHGLGYAGYGHGLYGYAGYGHAGYRHAYGLPAYGYSVAHATPVTHTVSTTSYSYPAWTGYHGCHFGIHGCHVATEPVINLKGEPAEATAVEEARKKREADPEADPSFYYASFSSPSYGYSYGLHSGHAGYAGHGYAGHGYAGIGYAGLGYARHGYAGLGYAGHGYAGLGYAGHGYAGYHGLPRTYLGRYY